MDLETFQKFRRIVLNTCGIKLNETKMAMVSSRVAKRMRILGIDSHREYLNYLVNENSREETIKFIDVISTNTTFFFREQEHFEFLEKLISDRVSKGQRKIRIWCAASSTGEEPYTIAMTLLAASSGKNIDMKILATDISTKVLAKAQAGEYESDKMEKVPIEYKKKFFSLSDKDDDLYVAKDLLKNMILFRRLNLSTPPYPMNGQLDVVFCRNVMIYFNDEVRVKLVSEIFRLLKPDGYLIIGHAESITNLKTDFKCVVPSIYIKN